jgi:hypothetical protein
MAGQRGRVQRPAPGLGADGGALVFWPALLFGAAYQRWRDWRLCALLHGLCNAFAISACAS